MAHPPIRPDGAPPIPRRSQAPEDQEPIVRAADRPTRSYLRPSRLAASFDVRHADSSRAAMAVKTTATTRKEAVPMKSDKSNRARAVSETVGHQ